MRYVLWKTHCTDEEIEAKGMWVTYTRSLSVAEFWLISAYNLDSMMVEYWQCRWQTHLSSGSALPSGYNLSPSAIPPRSSMGWPWMSPPPSYPSCHIVTYCSHTHLSAAPGGTCFTLHFLNPHIHFPHPLLVYLATAYSSGKSQLNPILKPKLAPPTPPSLPLRVCLTHIHG